MKREEESCLKLEKAEALDNRSACYTSTIRALGPRLSPDAQIVASGMQDKGPATDADGTVQSDVLEAIANADHAVGASLNVAPVAGMSLLGVRTSVGAGKGERDWTFLNSGLGRHRSRWISQLGTPQNPLRGERGHQNRTRNRSPHATNASKQRRQPQC